MIDFDGVILMHGTLIEELIQLKRNEIDSLLILNQLCIATSLATSPCYVACHVTCHVVCHVTCHVISSDLEIPEMRSVHHIRCQSHYSESIIRILREFPEFLYGRKS